MKAFVSSFRGHMVAGIVTIQALLAPVLFFGFLFIVDEGYKSQFINQVRSHSYLLGALLSRELANGTNSTVPGILEEPLLDGSATFIELETSQGTLYRPDTVIASDNQYTAEDFRFGQRGDSTYFLVSELHDADGSHLGTLRVGYDEVPTEELIAATYSRGLTLAGGYVFLSLVLVVIVGNRLTRPLEQIRDRARRMAQGETTSQNILTSISEIRTLAEHLDWMYEESRRSSLEIAKAQSDLALSRSKSEFLATISHEIRTPVNGIMGMTELLLDTRLTAAQERFANTVLKSSENLLELINDLLDFSKIAAGKWTPNHADFDLRALVEELGDLFSRDAQSKGLEWGYSIHPSCPKAVIGDIGLVRQILSNLLANAIKFTEKGEVFLNISVVDLADRNATLRFEVTDTGIGLPSDKLEAVFEPFVQADGSITRVYGGTGLGLAITKQIVTLLGGSTGASSIPGKGSTFWCTLSMTTQSVDADEIGNTSFKLDDTRVLIVTQYESLRLTLGNQLDGCNVAYESAGNGSEATALFMLRKAAREHSSFDLVILDQETPTMDPFTLGGAIRDDPEIKNTFLLMLRPFGTAESALPTRGLRFDAYLSKPLRQSELFDCLAGLVDRREVPSTMPARQVVEGREPLGASILVAEDNLVNQCVVMGMLESFRCQPSAVSDGLHAVQAWREGSFDLILMDIHMPEMDGLKATAEIRKFEAEEQIRRTPIIAVTADALEGDRERCLAGGLDDYLSKPYHREQLLEIIKRWLPTNTRSASPNIQSPPEALTEAVSVRLAEETATFPAKQEFQT